MNSVFYFFLVVALVSAEDLSNGKEGTNVELGNSFSFSSLIDSNGKPTGTVFSHINGKLSQIPQQPTFYQADPNAVEPPPSSPSGSGSGIMSQVASVSYFAGGVAAALSIWYICSLALSKKTVEELSDMKTLEESPSSNSTEIKSSRRRRSAGTSNDEMTRLASIVLAAV